MKSWLAAYTGRPADEPNPRDHAVGGETLLSRPKLVARCRRCRCISWKVSARGEARGVRAHQFARRALLAYRALPHRPRRVSRGSPLSSSSPLIVHPLCAPGQLLRDGSHFGTARERLEPKMHLGKFTPRVCSRIQIDLGKRVLGVADHTATHPSAWTRPPRSAVSLHRRSASSRIRGCARRTGVPAEATPSWKRSSAMMRRYCARRVGPSRGNPGTSNRPVSNARRAERPPHPGNGARSNCAVVSSGTRRVASDPRAHDDGDGSIHGRPFLRCIGMTEGPASRRGRVVHGPLQKRSGGGGAQTGDAVAARQTRQVEWARLWPRVNLTE